MTRRFMMKNGHVMAVIRPSDPAKAKRLTEEWVARGLTGDENARAFNAILQAQEYRFVGIAEHPPHGYKGYPRLLDRETREVIGKMRAWDSFVALDDLDMAQEAEKHADEAKALVDAALAEAAKK